MTCRRAAERRSNQSQRFFCPSFLMTPLPDPPSHPRSHAESDLAHAYAAYVRTSIEAGRRDADEGRTMSQAEAVAHVRARIDATSRATHSKARGAAG